MVMTTPRSSPAVRGSVRTRLTGSTVNVPHPVPAWVNDSSTPLTITDAVRCAGFMFGSAVT